MQPAGRGSCTKCGTADPAERAGPKIPDEERKGSKRGCLGLGGRSPLSLPRSSSCFRTSVPLIWKTGRQGVSFSSVPPRGAPNGGAPRAGDKTLRRRGSAATRRLRRRITLICADCPEGPSRMTVLRRELPPSLRASPPGRGPGVAGGRRGLSNRACLASQSSAASGCCRISPLAPAPTPPGPPAPSGSGRPR